MQEGNAVNKAFVRYVNEFYNPACDTRANVRTPDEVKTVLRQHFPGEAVQDVYSFNDATGICDKLEKLQNTLNHKTSVGWAAFAQQLDKEYLAARSSEGRRAGARPFSGIRITESESNTDFPKAIATIRELPENSVIILGVDRQIKSGSDPHSVAVFKVNKEIFQFLDANYGVFQYDIKGVLKALLYLFKEFEGKTGIYGEDGASVPGTLNYVVFTA